MENENEGVEDEIVEDEESDTTDWKAEAKKQEGIAKRNATKLAKLKATKEDKAKPEAKTEELGYGEKAFLKAHGISGKDAMELVNEYMALGKDLDDIVDNKHFKNDLKDIEEAKAVKKATPKGSKRSSTSARDTVDYWIAKGELPPVDQVQLRRDVVNAKIKKTTSGNKFSSNPVIS